MSEDDDWFESAFEDDADRAESEESVEDVDTNGQSTPTDESDSGDTADPFDDAATGDGDDPFAADSDADFDDDDAFAGAEAASGEAESPFESDDPFAGDTGEEDDSPFGGGGSEDAGDSAFAEEDDEGSLFDDDFGSAMASAGPGGGDGGSSSQDFDEEDFESDIPRIDLGIDGLDRMIQGGIPERHLMVSIGSPGTGKTTFGLQFLYHGLTKDQKAVFITLEQSREAILDTANERGWEFDRYEQEDKLAIVDLDPVEMANSLDNIRGELPVLIQEFDADRLVLDSVSLLEMMYDDQAKRRTEVFDFTRSLKAAGVTTMLTSEAADDNPYTSRHGIIEYLTDAVFVLQYVRGDSSETRLAIEIQKIRNANHSRATKPYEITLEGIDVYQQASIF